MTAADRLPEYGDTLRKRNGRAFRVDDVIRAGETTGDRFPPYPAKDYDRVREMALYATMPLIRVSPGWVYVRRYDGGIVTVEE